MPFGDLLRIWVKNRKGKKTESKRTTNAVTRQWTNQAQQAEFVTQYGGNLPLRNKIDNGGINEKWLPDFWVFSFVLTEIL